MKTNDPKAQGTAEVLNRKIKALKTEIAKFTSKFAEDPAYALEWGDGIFQAAASLRIYSSALDALTHTDSKATLETLTEHAHREMVRLIRINRSTSQAGNMMEYAAAVAWRDLWEIVSLELSVETRKAEAAKASK